MITGPSLGAEARLDRPGARPLPWTMAAVLDPGPGPAPVPARAGGPLRPLALAATFALVLFQLLMLVRLDQRVEQLRLAEAERPSFHEGLRAGLERDAGWFHLGGTL